MNPDRLAALVRNGVAFDTETHLVQPGLLAPPLVCGSVAAVDQGKLTGTLLDKAQAGHVATQILKTPELTLIGANIAYDILVIAVDAARQGVDLMPAIFDAYDQGRIYDVQIAEALHGVAIGMLGMDPRTGHPLTNPETGRRGRYSLATCVEIVLGRKNAKENDEFRFAYAELEHTPISEWPLNARAYPVDDAVNTLEVALEQARSRRNLHNLASQVYAAWAMHLGASWGFHVDPAAVKALSDRAERIRLDGEEAFIRGGLLARDPKTGKAKKVSAEIKRRVAIAFGAIHACQLCVDGKRPSAKTGALVICPDCSGTQLDLDRAPNVPRTPTGGVEAGRDTLNESGDELLIDFAQFGETAKLESTYLPWLQSGIDDQGRSRPINLRPNVLLETGRASYGDVVQLLPRGMGVRECITARPGYVLASVDYGGLELVTHAQSCLWTVGWSRLAEWINRDGASAAHAALGAQLAGVAFDSFRSRLKSEPFFKDCRQAAKAGNFGFPGGMGEAKLVLQQRMSGPDTTSPTTGQVYKGLRFCLLMGDESACGRTKVTEWKGRPCPPTCVRCLECAATLRAKWFATFPENREYFNYVALQIEARGEITQHVSNRVRGGVEFCAAANGLFQGLASDGAKLALCRVAREQYVDRGTALFGSRTILFAHDELVLEIPEALGHEAAHRVSEIMVESMRAYCPDVAVEAPPALMRRWYKGADPVYVDGRLVPWEPRK